jgi:peptidoglycan lytic transglycosylase
MKTGRNRRGRKDHPRLGRASSVRPLRLARWAAPALVAAVLALAAGSAQGETGGASTGTAGQAQAGGGGGFTALRWAGATWYGPGFYGSRTACGQVLHPHTIGVAHRDLPCGTTVRLVYHGHAIVTKVIDRGPYSRGNSWDLTNGARRALRFNGSDRVGYAVPIQYARKSG